VLCRKEGSQRRKLKVLADLISRQKELAEDIRSRLKAYALRAAEGDTLDQLWASLASNPRTTSC